MVKHGIDTGDHAPVRQPYLTPIIRCEKMAAKIGEQGIVKPSATSPIKEMEAFVSVSTTDG